jgi:tetratricopeptide (TPR) repeat protein
MATLKYKFIEMKFLLLLPILLLLFCACNFNDKKRALEFNSKGLLYLQEGNEEKAIAAFKEVLKMHNLADTDRSECLRNLAITYKQKYLKDTLLNQPVRDSVRYYFFQAAIINSKSSYFYFVNMADVYLLDKDVARAVDCLVSALDITPEKLAVNNLLGLIYLGEYDKKYFNPAKALRYNLKVDGLSSTRLSRSVLAKNYYYLEEYPKAIAAYRDLYDQYPQFTDYLLSVISIEQQHGQKAAANKDLEDLKQSDPSLYRQYMEANTAE